MSVEFYRGSPGKFDSRTLSRKTLSRWTGRTASFVAYALRRVKDEHTSLHDSPRLKKACVREVVLRPVRLLRVSISEGLTQADS